MQLERELATYKASLPGLLQHEGKYVLIQGDSVVDTYTSYADALRQGYSQLGLEPFLVKQIARIEPLRLITRLIVPALRPVA